MVKFVEVAPEEIPFMKQGRRGRVSYPILKSFMESGIRCVQLDRTGMQQTLTNLNSTLTQYAKKHDMPIKVFMARGELYLMRLDMDEDGNIDENWTPHPKTTEGRYPTEGHLAPQPITTIEVERRAKEEKGQITK